MTWELKLIKQMLDDPKCQVMIDQVLTEFWTGSIRDEELVNRIMAIKVMAETDHSRFPADDCDCFACFKPPKAGL